MRSCSGEEVSLGGSLVRGGDFLVDRACVRILHNLVSEEVIEAVVGGILELGRNADQVDDAEHGADNVLGTLLTLGR